MTLRLAPINASPSIFELITVLSPAPLSSRIWTILNVALRHSLPIIKKKKEFCHKFNHDSIKFNCLTFYKVKPIENIRLGRAWVLPSRKYQTSKHRRISECTRWSIIIFSRNYFTDENIFKPRKFLHRRKYCCEVNPQEYSHRKCASGGKECSARKFSCKNRRKRNHQPRRGPRVRGWEVNGPPFGGQVVAPIKRSWKRARDEEGAAAQKLIVREVTFEEEKRCARAKGNRWAGEWGRITWNGSASSRGWVKCVREKGRQWVREGERIGIAKGGREGRREACARERDGKRGWKLHCSTRPWLTEAPSIGLSVWFRDRSASNWFSLSTKETPKQPPSRFIAPCSLLTDGGKNCNYACLVNRLT